VPRSRWQARTHPTNDVSDAARWPASATRFAYLAIHGGQYAPARVALIDPTEDDNEEDDLGGEHRRIVRESTRYFFDDAGADLPVPHRIKLSVGRVGMSQTADCDAKINGNVL
jgi:hypothetical protein